MCQLSSTILLSYSALALYRYHPCILPKYHQLSGYQHVSTCINSHWLSCCHTVPWPFTDTIHVYYPNIISYQGINMYQHVSTIIDYPVVIQFLGPLPIPSMYITHISSAIRVSTCINMYQLSSTILLSYSALALYRYHPCILPKYHQLSGYQHVSTCINYHRLSYCHTVPWPFADTIHVSYPHIISYQGIKMYQHVSTIIDYPIVIECLGPNFWRIIPVLVTG